MKLHTDILHSFKEIGVTQLPLCFNLAAWRLMDCPVVVSVVRRVSDVPYASYDADYDGAKFMFNCVTSTQITFYQKPDS